jgi:hypothetical protein
MHITYPGLFLLPLGFLLLLAPVKYLYYITLFFIPFSATSVLNGKSGAALLAAQYLGSMLILRELCAAILTKGRPKLIKSYHDKSFFFMLVFGVVVTTSMAMPAIIDGKMSVSTMKIPDFEEVPVSLTSKNIKNPLPVIFGLLLAYVIAKRSATLHRLLSSICVYACSATFVSAWGGLESFCFYLNIPFPYFIFNSAIHDSVMAFGTTSNIWGFDFLRIESVTLEPSYFAQVLLLVVPCLIMAVTCNVHIISRIMDRVMITVIVVGLLMSTSASAYIGLGIIALVYILIGHNSGVICVRYYVFTGLVLALLGWLIYELVPLVNNAVTQIIDDKASSSSAFERVNSIKTAWEYFLVYPLLGLGWGIVTSHDLVVHLLANSGVIGLASFVMLIMYVCLRSRRLIRKIRSEIDQRGHTLTLWSTVLNISLLSHIGISLSSEFTSFLPHFYFMLGMVIAANICCDRHLAHSRAQWEAHASKAYSVLRPSTKFTS